MQQERQKKQWTQESSVVANRCDRTNNNAKSARCTSSIRLRVFCLNLFIFLKSLGEVSQDTVGAWNVLIRLIRGLKKKTSTLNDIPIKI